MISKDELNTPLREEVPLESFRGLRGSLWVRSLSAYDRAQYIKTLFADDGKYVGEGQRERLLALTVERQVGSDDAPVYELVYASEAEARAIRPDLADVLYDIACRLSVIRDEDRTAVKNAFRGVPSSASPSISPSDSDTPR